jgi:hypothetical protein
MLIFWIGLIWGTACLFLTTLWILMAPGIHLSRFSATLEDRDLSYF